MVILVKEAIAVKRITSACLEQTIRFFDATGTIRPEDELEQYKWKTDRITGASLNEPEDKNNHAIDAIRYVALRYLAQAPQRMRPRGLITSY